jgi:hypothetical protein
VALDDRTIVRRPRPPRGSDIHHRGPSLRRWILLGLGAVVAGAALTLWWMSRSQPEPAPPAPTAATDVPLAPARPRPETIDLPPLENSDTLLRNLVSSLSRHPLIAALIVPKELVRSIVLAVVQVGDGVTPVTALAPARPAARLQIAGDSGRIDPANYRRWDTAVAAVTSINTAELAQTYVNLKPLFDQAYRELGHPGGSFDDALVRAYQTLDATPEITTDPVLLRRTGYFEHDDPSLRALLPVQKQFLLLGSAHRQRVMTWLRDLARSLDLKIG